MDLIDRLQNLASKIEKLKDTIQTEEATKNAFVLPFISALGYDIFDPTEVIPEFTTDVGIKKGEKVDYAIFLNDIPIVLIECKKVGVNLQEIHSSQLYRYFSVSTARLGILTDGVLYKFYTDLEEINKMDSKPFFEFSMLALDEGIVAEIKKFSKTLFNIVDMVSSAGELKYTKEIKNILAEQFNNPNEEFVKFFLPKIYSGRATQSALEQFTSIVKRATNQFLNEKINDRLKFALASSGQSVEGLLSVESPSDQSTQQTEEEKVVTTHEEVEGYLVVKAILRNTLDLSRVVGRDTQTYFGILLDDNNRKPICRLRFNHSQKYLGLIDSQKNETKVPINSLDDIYKHADKIIETVKLYSTNA